MLHRATKQKDFSKIMTLAFTCSFMGDYWPKTQTWIPKKYECWKYLTVLPAGVLVGLSFNSYQHMVHWLLVGMIPDFALGFCPKPVLIRELLHLPTVLGISQNTGKLQRTVMVFRRHLLICICMGNIIEISPEQRVG